MRSIIGKKMKTVHLNANEVTEIVYASGAAVDLYNAGGSDVWIACDDETAAVGNEDCMLLPSDGGAYNNLNITKRITLISNEPTIISVIKRG